MSWPGSIALVVMETEPNIDPNVARPGIIPLLITLALLGALVLLFLSMRKQIRKIQIPREEPAELDELDEAGEDDEPDQRAEPSVSGKPDAADRPDKPDRASSPGA